MLAEPSDARQRAYAARALGCDDRSPEQIAALLAAAFDSDDGVRNNAVRALWVLDTPGAEVTTRIPPAAPPMDGISPRPITNLPTQTRPSQLRPTKIGMAVNR